MPALRLALATCITVLVVIAGGRVTAQTSSGNHATIVLGSGAPINQPPVHRPVQGMQVSPGYNQARLVYQPLAETESSRAIRADQQVATASHVVPGKSAASSAQDPVDSRAASNRQLDARVNPFDPDISTRADVPDPGPQPAREQGPVSAWQPGSQNQPKVPVLYGNGAKPPPPPVMSVSKPLALPAWPQKQPAPNPQSPFLPGLPLLDQHSPPAVNGELRQNSPPPVQPGSMLPVVRPAAEAGTPIDAWQHRELPNEWQSDSWTDNCQTCRPLFYLDLFGGFNEFESGVGRSINAISSDTTINFETGFDFGTRLGIYQGQNLRTDFEFSFQFSDVTTQYPYVVPGPNPQPGQANTPGDLTTWTGLGNVYWDFTNSPFRRIQPYVGAGVGFLYANADFLTYQPTGPEPFLDTDSSIAFQLMAGGTWQVTSRLDFFGEYRYLDADAVILSTETGVIANGMNAPASFIQPTQIDLSGNSVVFGMRMKF